MGRRTAKAVSGHRADRALPPHGTAYDTGWAGSVRFATGCAVLLLGLLVTVDTTAGHLTWPRALLWAGLGALLFVVLVPSRVSAGSGWLASRGLLRTRIVRTDRLVSARWTDGISQRLVLRDAEHNGVEVDPRALVANPALWGFLNEDIRACVTRGTVRYDVPAFEQLAARIDNETARTVFKVSDLG
jgi:hypothetical protein